MDSQDAQDPTKLNEISFRSRVLTLAVGVILLSHAFPANSYGIETRLPDIGSPISKLDTIEPELKFHGEVDAILFQYCSKCHRPENSAPFSLLSVDDATANAQMIAEVVRDQTMPPWYASKNHGVFQNDASLTRKELQTLLRWVETGCLAGDVAAGKPIPGNAVADSEIQF